MTSRGLGRQPQVAIGIECMQSRRLSETIQFEYKHYTNGKCIVPAFLATLTLYKSVHGDVDTMWSRCREQCNLSPTCHFIGRYVNGDNDLMRCDFIESATTIGTLFNDNVHQKIIPHPLATAPTARHAVRAVRCSELLSPPWDRVPR